MSLATMVLSVVLAAPPVSSTPVASTTPVMSMEHRGLQPGQRFEIVTKHHVMRGEFIDPDTGECVVAKSSRGRPFGPPQRLWLLGATQGRQSGAGGLQMTLMHQVRVGMKMELGRGDLSRENRTVTEPVQSILLLGKSSVGVAQTSVR
ncbi:MAG: hypothetical protein K8T91_07965 [Planctomycetes bacterium]|nr:hypothetical protein [Planctomycetota bacterium]